MNCGRNENHAQLWLAQDSSQYPPLSSKEYTALESGESVAPIANAFFALAGITYVVSEGPSFPTANMGRKSR